MKHPTNAVTSDPPPITAPAPAVPRPEVILVHKQPRHVTSVGLWSAPVLAVQSLYLRMRRSLQPDARRLDEGVVPGPGSPPFRLAVVGESTAVGVSVEGSSGGIAEAIATQLRDQLGRQVEWTVRRAHGSTVQFLRHHIIPQVADDHDLVVLLAGVSDAIGGQSLKDWGIDISAAIQDLAVRNRHVLVAGLPRLEDFPQLPSPLSEFLDRRARDMDAETRRIAAHSDNVTFSSSRHMAPLTPEMFARDGMHLTSAGYAAWAATLVATYFSAPRTVAQF